VDDVSGTLRQPELARGPVAPEHLDEPAASRSAADSLRRRLDLLPAGHPSSPYDADGRARPPVARLPELAAEEPDEDEGTGPDHSPDDAARPLTDSEWSEHVTEIRASLEKAHANGLATDHQYTIDAGGEAWVRSRRLAHKTILNDLYQRHSAVPCEHKAIVAGGLGGAGKSTVLEKHASIDRSEYLTINPDDIKEELAARGLVPEVAGLSPMEASDLVHEETSYLAKQVALLALADGKNVIWDITMSSRTSTERRITELRAAGYSRIDAVFVDIPVETSVQRADARHRAGHDEYRAGHGLGGRFVPHDVIRAQQDSQLGSVNRKTFEDVKHRFDSWSRYDNSVNGRDAVLVEQSREDGLSEEAK
jgi:predicted kinase